MSTGSGYTTGTNAGTTTTGSGAPACTSIVNDCNCFYEGCTDPLYTEYDANATCDNGTCNTGVVMGCTDATLLGYNPAATVDDGTCGALAVSGCTDSTAYNHNAAANTGCNWQSGPSVPSPQQITTGGGGTSGGGTNPPPPSAFAGSGAYSNFNERGFGGINDRRGYSNFNESGFGGINDRRNGTDFVDTSRGNFVSFSGLWM